MKVIVNALLGSVTALFNVVIVIMMVWVMFAILGISFFGNKMAHCEGIDDYYNIGIVQCERIGGTWTNFEGNFDNILNSFVTLFVLSSLEGWPNFMAYALDSNDAEVGPSYNNNIFAAFYFL